MNINNSSINSKVSSFELDIQKIVNFDANSKIIYISKGNYLIEIYSMATKKLLNSIKFKSYVVHFQSHPKYYNVLGVSLYDLSVLLLQIDIDNNKIETKVTYKTNFYKGIKKTLFCPDNDSSVLASLFFDAINIWDMNSHHYIYNISFDDNMSPSSNQDIKWTQTGKYLIFQRYTNLIEVFSLLHKKLLYTFESSSNHYFFSEKDKKIIIFEEGDEEENEKGNILVYNIENNEEINKINCEVFSIVKPLFDEKNSLFFLLTKKNIFIYDLVSKKKIFKYKGGFFHNFIFLKNNDNESKLLTKLMAYFNYNNFEILSIYKENLKNIYETNEQEAPYYFWNKSIKKIDDNYEFYSYKYNIYEDDEINPKQYLSIKQIDEEYESLLMNKTLEEKRELVNNNKIICSENCDVSIVYIEYIKSLIKDNTNTELLINYLTFLKKNNDELRVIFKENFENYNDEIKQFQVCFSQSFLKEKLKYIKLKSEKEQLMNLLNNIIKINNFVDLEKIIKDEKKVFENFKFNQPISFENRELYFYQNKQIIIYSIEDILNNEETESFENMKYCINKVLEKNLLEDPNILKDCLKLTLIFILISSPQRKIITDYNLNLINDEKNIVIEEKLIELGFIYNKTEKKYEYEDKNLIINEDEIKLLNLDNLQLILNDKEYNDEFKIYELYKYNAMMEFYKKHFDEDKVRKFISNILISNVIKELFSFLYGNKIKYPFFDDVNKKGKDKALEFVRKYLKFIPFKFDDTSAVTNKFTMETYIFLNSKIMSTEIKKIPKVKMDYNKISEALINGAIILINDHELNHNFHNYFYFSKNGKESLKTPRKKEIEIREGGFNLENILFGKILENLTLRQALYILNEENYKKSLYEYRCGFLLLENKDCKCKGIFEDYSKLKIEDLGKFSDYTVVRFKSNPNINYSIPIHLKNDVLGFRSVHLNNNAYKLKKINK